MGAGAQGGSSDAGAAGNAGMPTGPDWDDVCGGVTLNGRCTGNVYEWCDYFTRSVETLDCTALGMTCQATPTQWYEDELNGCVGDPCTTYGNGTCAGPVLLFCVEDAVHARDCRQARGRDAVCITEGDQAGCTYNPCDTPWEATCDGSMLASCNEDGNLHLVNCKRCDPAGTCVFEDEPFMDPLTYCSAPTMGCSVSQPADP